MRATSHWKWKFAFMFLVFGAILVAVVMWLWNILLPDLFGVPSISYFQAAGLLLLSKILFGGWNKKAGNHSCQGKNHWMQNMKSKWEEMSPDQKDQFKTRWGWMEKQNIESDPKADQK